ncbi:pyridoxamine 5'-phosphate oxidase family protein [Nocardiopsis sp. CNT-189]|uniref:pyridoxamine 5'-phosphate oxidase family protein n=1 Tax=Nocardiopsis oceanisediminis TaxID=2816862 RepID=UPI003B3886F3
MSDRSEGGPATRLDERYSGEGAEAVPWPQARGVLEKAGIFWLTTVRPDGRPHTTPLIAVWSEGAVYFCTGADERKARNLAGNPHVTLVTGSSDLHSGLDVVVEGEAERTGDEALLRRVAGAYTAKYGDEWRFEVEDGAFRHPDGGRADVYRVAPVTAFGFARGAAYGQTRWRFAPAG